MAEFAQTNKARFLKPVIGGVTSPFGMRGGKLHAGVDFGSPLGAPIKASMDGRVIRSEWFDGYGKCIDVYHGGGYMTRYAHQSMLMAKKNEAVSQGEIIGLVGSTGDSTGPHLHFEIRLNGKPVNPMPLLGKSVDIDPDKPGSSSPLNPIPEEFNVFLQSLVDTKTWLRMGMIILGIGLVGIGLFTLIKKGKK